MHAPRPAGVILHFDFKFAIPVAPYGISAEIIVQSVTVPIVFEGAGPIKVSNRLETEVGTLVSWSSILWDSFGLPV